VGEALHGSKNIATGLPPDGLYAGGNLLADQLADDLRRGLVIDFRNNHNVVSGYLVKQLQQVSLAVLPKISPFSIVKVPSKLFSPLFLIWFVKQRA
jgi:hypothetical protein